MNGAGRIPIKSPSRAIAVAMLTGWALAAIATRNRPPRPQPRLPMWMGLSEASGYSGLSQGLLLRLVDQRKVLAISDGELKVRRSDLDRVAKLRDLANLGAELRRMKGRGR